MVKSKIFRCLPVSDTQKTTTLAFKLKVEMLIIRTLTHSYRRLFNCLMFYDQAN